MKRSASIFVQFCVLIVVSVFAAPLAFAQPGRPMELGEDITKEKIESADLSVLFIGNSHSHPIPDLVKRIYKVNQPKKKGFFAVVPGYGFLANHAKDPNTLGLLKKGKWDYVVLQAQKYSTTGRYTYPIDGALKLSKIAKEQGTKVVMYPEWSRRNVPEEYKRINKLHHKIAKQTKATVAPIGQTWASVLKNHSAIKLYSSDGNHANRSGSYLNACIFYGIFTGKKVETSPKVPRSNASKSVLKTLQQSSWDSLKKEKLVPKEKSKK